QFAPGEPPGAVGPAIRPRRREEASVAGPLESVEAGFFQPATCQQYRRRGEPLGVEDGLHNTVAQHLSVRRRLELEPSKQRPGGELPLHPPTGPLRTEV